MKETIQKPRRHGKALTVVLCVLLALLVLAGTATGLMLSDPRAESRKTPPAASDALIRTLAPAVLSGKEAAVTADEVNGYLALLQKEQKSAEGAETRILYASVEFEPDGTMGLYLPTRYRGKTFGVFLTAALSYDSAENRFVLDVKRAQIGRLPVPPARLLSFGKRAFPEGVSVSGTEIRGGGSLFRFEYGGVSAQLRLAGLRVENRMLYVKTAGDLNLPFAGIFS